MDCGRFQGEEGGNDNADWFGLVVQKRGCWCWSGWREVGGDRRMDRRFGVKMGVMEGGLYPIIKNAKRKVWLDPLFNRAYAAFHGVLNGS